MSEPINLADLRAAATEHLGERWIYDWYDGGAAPSAEQVLALVDAVVAAKAITLLRGVASIQPSDLAYLASRLERFDFGLRR